MPEAIVIEGTTTDVTVESKDTSKRVKRILIGTAIGAAAVGAFFLGRKFAEDNDIDVPEFPVSDLLTENL